MRLQRRFLLDLITASCRAVDTSAAATRLIKRSHSILLGCGNFRLFPQRTLLWVSLARAVSNEVL